MNKRYYIFALLISLILLVAACQTGRTTGGAPREPFIGGTSGIVINFEKDSPPPEVTDDSTFEFNAIVSLKNDGETKVDQNEVRVNLIGFDPQDFGLGSFDAVRDHSPTDDLEAKTRGAEGDIQEGTTTFVTFPKDDDFFNPQKFIGNTEFTFRADICYKYETKSQARVCVLRDMINVNDNDLCRPSGTRPLFSSSAPVQIANFKQSVIGPNKLTFTFDIVLSGNVDIFWSEQKTTPASGFDGGCPRAPRERRQVENQVGVELTEIPTDPIVTSFKCGGLEADFKGVVKLINGRRTIVCTVELTEDRNDLEKQIGILVDYNVLDNKETSILVKHLAD